MQQDQWHYKDERNGKRCGPVDRDAITKLTPAILKTPDEERFAIYAIPFSAAYARDFIKSFFTPPRSIVVVRRLKSDAVIDPTIIRDVFQLTLAESRVAAFVAAGIEPKVAAARLQIAEDTVRKTIKAIFLKTNTHRQAELALLLSRLAPNGTNPVSSEDDHAS